MRLGNYYNRKVIKMPILNMDGPYTFNREIINAKVKKISAGNYALGHTNDKGVFIVCYVGRSDNDLNHRLCCQLNEHPHPMFKFSYATSSKEAYEKECQNFHDFGGVQRLENEIHPDNPNRMYCRCPKCGY